MKRIRPNTRSAKHKTLVVRKPLEKNYTVSMTFGNHYKDCMEINVTTKLFAYLLGKHPLVDINGIHIYPEKDSLKTFGQKSIKFVVKNWCVHVEGTITLFLYQTRY